jgi:hypothetical protein
MEDDDSVPAELQRWVGQQSNLERRHLAASDLPCQLPGNQGDPTNISCDMGAGAGLNPVGGRERVGLTCRKFGGWRWVTCIVKGSKFFLEKQKCVPKTSRSASILVRVVSYTLGPPKW